MDDRKVSCAGATASDSANDDVGNLGSNGDLLVRNKGVAVSSTSSSVRSGVSTAVGTKDFGVTSNSSTVRTRRDLAISNNGVAVARDCRNLRTLGIGMSNNGVGLGTSSSKVGTTNNGSGDNSNNESSVFNNKNFNNGSGNDVIVSNKALCLHSSKSTVSTGKALRVANNRAVAAKPASNSAAILSCSGANAVSNNAFVNANSSVVTRSVSNGNRNIVTFSADRDTNAEVIIGSGGKGAVVSRRPRLSCRVMMVDSPSVGRKSACRMAMNDGADRLGTRWYGVFGKRLSSSEYPLGFLVGGWASLFGGLGFL